MDWLWPSGGQSPESELSIPQVAIEQLWPNYLWSNDRYADARISLLSRQQWNELARLVRKRSGADTGGISRIERHRRKRFAKRVIRELRRKRWQKRFPPPPRHILAGRQRSSILLDAFLPARATDWVSIAKRNHRRNKISLNQFSIIDDPQNAIELLVRLVRAEATDSKVEVDFIDNACLDVSPYLIFALMRADMVPVFVGGKVTASVGSMIDSVGLSGPLGMARLGRNSHDPTFFPFSIRMRRKTGTSSSTNIALQPSTKEYIADELVKTVDKWLGMLASQALNDEGRGRVANMVTEVLNNAERHSDLSIRDGDWSKDGDWAIAGFLSSVKTALDSKDITYFCTLGIVSIGATIADSLEKCEDLDISSLRDNYASRYEHAGFSRESLLSVFALQDGVSRFSQAGTNSLGGVGLMDMIQFVWGIGAGGGDRDEQRPAITLISGRTCLKIHHPLVKEGLFDVTGPRHLWFNEANTLEQAPDPDYVSALPVHFPGTVVAVRFCILPGEDSPLMGA